MMTERILIVGAGYTGLRLAERAVSQGVEVVGTSRTDESLETIDGLGATGVRWEADAGADVLSDYMEPGVAVVYSVPTLFGGYEAASEGEDARHVQPVSNVLSAAERAGAGRFVYLSSTSVYGDHEGAWVDETDACRPTAPIGKMRRDIEEAVLEHDGETTTNVGRLVGIYGPGRTLARFIESGRYRVVNRDKPTNRVHVDDIVTAIMAMIGEGGDENRLYNVSDGSPQKVGDVVDWLVERYDLPEPPETTLEAYAEQRSEDAVARWANTYRVSNARLVDELGVELAYEDVYEGYRSLLG
jgi:nucleoside-diphosphate-sugar epimerase